MPDDAFGGVDASGAHHIRESALGRSIYAPLLQTTKQGQQLGTSGVKQEV